MLWFTFNFNKLYEEIVVNQASSLSIITFQVALFFRWAFAGVSNFSCFLPVPTELNFAK